MTKEDQIEQSISSTTSKLALLDLLTHADPSVRAYGRLLSTSALSEFDKWAKAEIARNTRPADFVLASQQFVGILIVNVIHQCALEGHESSALDAYLRTLANGLDATKVTTINYEGFNV